MKKLLSMLAISTIGTTSASNLKPVFMNNVVSHSLKSSQINNKDITNPFINKIEMKGFSTEYVSAIAIAPNGTIYAGTVWKGLYVSHDGETFEQIKNGIPNDLLVYSISITNDGKDIYISSRQKGLYVSNDGGKTFKKFDKFDDGQHAESIYVAPNGNIYISAGRGLYISNDGGKTFKLLLSGILAEFFAVAPNGTIYAGGSDGLYKSVDQKKFSKVNQADPKGSIFKIGVIGLDGTIYVGIQDNNEGRGFYKSGFYSSDDGGKTFKKINTLDNGTNIDVTGVTITPNGTIFVASGNGLYISPDLTKTFYKVSDVVSDLIEPLAVAPNGTIFVVSKNNYYKFNLNDTILELNKPNYIGSLYQGFVYNKENKINIKKEYLETATLDNKNITLPAANLDITVGEHNLILTLKNNYKKYAYLFGGDPNTGEVTYKLWVKTVIDKDKISYSTNIDDTNLLSGLISDLGNTNNAQIIQTKTKQGTGIHSATLSLNFEDILIDYSNSFYVQGTVNDTTNDFTAIGSKQKIKKGLTILNDGIYYLHLVDVVGNTYDSYLELGQNNWKLQGTFNDNELNDLSTKLNVIVNLTDPTEKQQAMSWLQKYQSDADKSFNNSVTSNGKGFNISINDLLHQYKDFLDPVTYTSLDSEEAINKNNLNQSITNISNKWLHDGLTELPQNLNINTSNVVNKSTLDNYSSWIKNYQQFIKKNKDQWINDIVNAAARGFATAQQIEDIRNHLTSLDFSKFLKDIIWTPNSNLATSNDYSQFIELDKLQKDASNWINQNIPDINQGYQNAITQAKSGLDLHGYTINQILGDRKSPQTKEEIESFEEGQSYHNWLQEQANSMFKVYQLKMGLGFGIPLALFTLGISIFLYWRFNKRNQPYSEKINRE